MGVVVVVEKLMDGAVQVVAMAEHLVVEQLVELEVVLLVEAEE